MVKTYNRPPMRDLGDGKAFITTSASNPMQRHITVVLDTPLAMSNGLHEVVCSCRGWINHKHCWHSDEVFMEVGSRPTREELEQELANLKELVKEMAGADCEDAHVTAKHYAKVWESNG